MRTVLTFLALPAFVLTATASAEPAPPPPPDPAVSSFVALDRLDGASRIGLDLTHLDNAQGGGLLFGGALFGRYVDPGSGFGGYASLPFGLGAGVRGNETVLELSGVELGGLFARRLSQSAAIVAHVGLATEPIADDVDYLGYSGLSNPRDLANAFAGTKFKLGVSPMFRSGNVMLRLDLGTVLATGSDLPAVVTFGGGAGFAADRFSLMVEVAGLALPGEDEALANAWLTGRLDLGRVRPYLGLGTPVTQARDLFPLLITLGADVAL